MKILFPKTFFVTGTDTGVGKTFISTILAKGLNASYYKPIQTGFPTDTNFVKKYSDLPKEHFLKETFLLKMQASPHLAAKKENKIIKLSDFNLPKRINTFHLIIEGVGGLLVPINKENFVIDIIKKFSIPTILVTRSCLGTINHTLLALFQLRTFAIPIIGIVINGKKNEENKLAIEKYGKAFILAEIEPQNKINSKIIQKLYKENFL